jgi:hypothetical protein
MPAEHDFRTIILKDRCLHCYANVTLAGGSGTRQFRARRGSDAADQAIVRDISR